MWRCHYCGSTLSLQVQLKNRLCPNCGSDLHCCKNCVHYNETSSNKCDEPDSPWISNYEAQNNCTYFEFRSTEKKVEPELKEEPSNQNNEAEKAKEAFRALFRTA